MNASQRERDMALIRCNMKANVKVLVMFKIPNYVNVNKQVVVYLDYLNFPLSCSDNYSDSVRFG